MAIGHPVYMDFVPDTGNPAYNPAGSQPALESWTPNIPRNLPFQPIEYYDNRLSPVPFALANVQYEGYTLAELYPYPQASETLYFAPPEPIRRDTYIQLATRLNNKAVSANAPTAGVYTGLPDLAFERL